MAWTVLALALLLAWDAGGLDLPLAVLAGGKASFPWRDSWLLDRVLHGDARIVAWLVGAWLLVGLWWPTGVLRRITRGARLQWLASAVLGLLLINLLKYASPTSCPWDLSGFGGSAHLVSHWAWAVFDGGPGHCFPAGHAAAGFAFVGGYFALRGPAPRAATGCLAVALSAGLVLGIAQQLRGAHFMSHTLWSGWICWVVAYALDAMVRRARPTLAGILPSHDIS
jgi:membrane-associated PAP2 superfamily phosphatase